LPVSRYINGILGMDFLICFQVVINVGKGNYSGLKFHNVLSVLGGDAVGFEQVSFAPRSA